MKRRCTIWPGCWTTIAGVTEASDGRVGYLHVPDMGPNGIREFIKWFYGQLRKDGLVIRRSLQRRR